MGVRPALIPILASYLTDREMEVRFCQTYSSTHKLPGGGPQGTLVGLIEYFVQSNDPDMRFKYVDDLTVLELVLLANLLTVSTTSNSMLPATLELTSTMYQLLAWHLKQTSTALLTGQLRTR